MKKIIILLLFLLLIGCNNDSDVTPTAVADAPPAADAAAETATAPPANEAETAVDADAITLRMIAYDWELGSYQDLIAAFTAENPGVAIEMVSLEETLGLDTGGVGDWPDDAPRQLASAADIIPTNAIGLVNGASGLLLDLQPLAAADPTFDRSDFYPNALAYFEHNGGLWGMPTLLNYSLIFYQKDAFDAAGIAYPQPGWTWDDLLAAAQALTVRTDGEVMQWGLVHSSRNPVQFIAGRTGPLIDDSVQPPAPRLDRPEVVAALQWYVDLYKQHEVAPNLPPPEPDEDGVFIPPEFTLIENGKAAMWVEFSGSWEWRRDQFNAGVAPFPVDAPDDRSTPMFVNGYVVSAGTRHPEMAWRWINFLSQQPSVDNFEQDTAVPARQSVAEADGFWDRIDPEFSAALQYAVDHAYFTSFTAGYEAFVEGVRAVLDGEQTAAAAMAAAQAAAELEIAEAQTAADTDDEAVVVAAPETESAPADAVTIVFAAGNGPGGIQPYRDMRETFQEMYPNVLVELQPPNSGSGPTSLSDLAADSDCMQWLGGVDSAADRAAVLSLEPLLDADPELSKEDFYATAVDAFSYQGQLLGLPAEINISVVMYNKALFDEAGVPYPQPDWTTDDFLETAVALTAGSNPATKQYGYVPQEFEINNLTIFMERLGAQILDESEEPPKLTLTHPDTVEAMRWVTGLTTEYGVKPTFTTLIGAPGGLEFGEQRKTLIENGRAAMWNDQGFESFPEINLDNLDIGIAPLPTGPDGTATPSTAIVGYYIAADTAQRQACWEWIKFLSAQPYVGGYGNTLPARISVAQSPAYAQTVGAELAAANRASVENVTGPTINLRLATDASWLALGNFWWQSYAYHQILTEDVPVEAALTAVQAKADAYRECIIAQNAQDDQNGQRACLGEVDDTVPSFLVETEEE